jgi:hypothetical protein
MTWKRRQECFWPKPHTRAQMDGRRPEVGDRVYCAGRPYIIEYVNRDGTVGIAYDTRAQPPQAK